MVSERDPVRRRLSRPVTFRGVGVHSGADAVCVVGPGSDGVVFRRTDDGGTVEASWRNVAATRLQTLGAVTACTNGGVHIGVGNPEQASHKT